MQLVILACFFVVSILAIVALPIILITLEFIAKRRIKTEELGPTKDEEERFVVAKSDLVKLESIIDCNNLINLQFCPNLSDSDRYDAEMAAMKIIHADKQISKIKITADGCGCQLRADGRYDERKIAARRINEEINNLELAKQNAASVLHNIKGNAESKKIHVVNTMIIIRHAVESRFQEYFSFQKYLWACRCALLGVLLSWLIAFVLKPEWIFELNGANYMEVLFPMVIVNIVLMIIGGVLGTIIAETKTSKWCP